MSRSFNEQFNRVNCSILQNDSLPRGFSSPRKGRKRERERERERERPIHSLKRDERWVYSAEGNRSSFHSFHLIDPPRLIPFSTIEFSIWRKLFCLFNSCTLGHIQTSWFNRITCRRYLTTCQTILVNFHLTRCVPRNPGYKMGITLIPVGQFIWKLFSLKPFSL